MAVGYLDLFVEQGETFSANISLTSTNDMSYNLYSYSVKSDIRKSHWSENITASFDSDIIYEESDIRISLAANTTQDMKPGKYVYDIFLTESISNTRSKILEGIVFVDPSATKI